MNAAEGARSFYKDREEREGTETDRTWSFHKKATRERGAGARPQPRSGSEGSTPRNKRNNVTTRINIGENALLKRNMNRNVTFRKRNKPQEAIVSDLEFFRSPRAKNNHGVAGLDAGHLGSLVPCRDHIRQQDCVIHV